MARLAAGRAVGVRRYVHQLDECNATRPSDGSEIAPALFIRALVPNLQLVLTSDDTTDDLKFRSDAPDRLVLEDYQQRMGWINSAALKYHKLMQGDKREAMFNYLEEIMSWADKPDV